MNRRSEKSICIVDCGSKRVASIESCLGETAVRVPLAEASSHCFDDYVATIISGGPHLFTGPDGPALLEHFAFIDDLRGPLLGLCLGHQAIGLRNGARVFRGPSRRRNETLTLRASHSLCDGIDGVFELAADHCEGISVPPGFVKIADSQYYDNEIMVAVDRPHFGIQSHPETSGEPGALLIANFIAIARASVPHSC